MIRKISVSDITMKLSACPQGDPLSFREKIELAKLLDKLGVSVIETAPILKGRSDVLLIKSIASAVQNGCVAVPLDIFQKDSAAQCWSALEGARHPRLQVPVPVSTVQMEYLCQKKPQKILELISELVGECRRLCPEVELIAEDASRSDQEFLLEAITKAVEAGATVVTICDTAGTMLPDEFQTRVAAIRKALPGHVRLGVRCANDLFMADSNAVAAVRAGADEIKVTAAGCQTASLERVARILSAKSDVCQVAMEVRITELQRGVQQIVRLMESGSRKSSCIQSLSGQDASDGLLVSVHEDLDAFTQAIRQMGYDLSDEDFQKVYEAFRQQAQGKTGMGSRELDAIVASVAYQVPATYVLDRYVINTGNAISATCHMRILNNGQIQECVCLGDGPVDAAFHALEKVIGRHFELDDFQISSVTQGREAMGEAVVRLRSGGRVHSGRGISTDIVGSSIRAYLSAVNKIVYEEGEA